MPVDPLQTAPGAYRLVFENHRVRLLEVRLQPGASIPMHWHPTCLVYHLGDGLIYNLGACRVKFNAPSGHSEEINVKAGDATWQPPQEHAVENLGETPITAILFELKDQDNR